MQGNVFINTFFFFLQCSNAEVSGEHTTAWNDSVEEWVIGNLATLKGHL